MKVLMHSFFDQGSRWYYPARWVIIILLGLAVYGQTFGFNFVFDDYYFMFDTSFIRGFDRINDIWAGMPRTRMIGVYSIALNYWLGRFDPMGYHIFNFLVHLAAVGLVWALANILFKIVKISAGRSAQELPFIIALLFLVHPCQTQAVTYIAQRFESMATVFYLGSIYFYLRGRIASVRRQKISLFICSIGFAFLGLFTKETAVTIPLMVLVIELILFKRKPLNSQRFYMLIAAAGILFLLLFMKIVRTDLIDIYFHFSAPSESHDGDIITGGKYVLTQMRVFLTFLRLLIFPFHQNLDYDYPLSTGLMGPPLTLAGLGVIVFIVFLICKWRQRWPLISLGLAWVLITFSINTAPRVNVIFEHKLYLISFGFLLAAVCALSALIKDRRALFGILIMAIAVLSFLSYQRNQVWKNDLTLWDDTVHKSPHKARPRYNRGFAYFSRGDFVRARSDLDEAIRIRPNYLEAYINRGIMSYEEGSFSQALSDYDQAIKIDPAVAEVYYDRGDVFAKQDDFTQALLNYNKAIALDPDYAEAYTNRGSLYVKQGNIIQALSDYNKAIGLYPPAASQWASNIGPKELKTASIGNVARRKYSSYADAYYDRACVFDRSGQLPQALADYDAAIEINPAYADAYNNRGYIYSRQGQYVQALSDLTKAIEINPDIAGYYYNRAVPDIKLGSNVQAIADLSKAIELDPYYANAYYNRAIFYYGSKEYAKARADVQRAEKLGAAINPEFLSALNKAL